MRYESKQEAIEAIFAEQQQDGCWNTYQEGDPYHPRYNYYSPTYSSTLWTLILLAEMQVDPYDERVKKPLTTLVEHFFDEEVGIFTLGASHFPIPCLNGNMLYLLGYFDFPEHEKMQRVLSFSHPFSVLMMVISKPRGSFRIMAIRVVMAHTPAIGVW